MQNFNLLEMPDRVEQEKKIRVIGYFAHPYFEKKAGFFSKRQELKNNCEKNHFF